MDKFERVLVTYVKNLPRPAPGNRKCDSDSCVTCDLMLAGTTFKSTMTGKDYKFMPNVGCHTKLIIYLVSMNQS